MLLLTFEGLTPTALSCYGSSWNRTEAIDALAATGTLWDRVVTNTTNPLEQLNQWLQSSGSEFSQTTLITDDDRLAELSGIDAVGELVHVPTQSDSVAGTIEETALASLAAVASEQIVAGKDVWLHSRFLTKCWDAPRDLFPIDHFDDIDEGPLDPSESIEEELRAESSPESFVIEKVPAILASSLPPEFSINAGDDPDWIMAWMRTYGCQVRLIDAIVDWLIGIESASENGPVLIAGTSGFALGQNNTIGHQAGPVRSCHLHVPVIVCQRKAVTQSDGLVAGVRNRCVTDANMISQALHQSTDRIITPDAWASDNTDQTVLTRHNGHLTAATTDRWFYVAENQNADSGQASADGKLFLKPDDACDFNDVARLRPETANTMRQWLLQEE